MKIANLQASTDPRFRAFVASFEEARGNVGLVERHFRVAGFDVCLQFAGDAVVPAVTRALSHLAGPGSDQYDLTVCIWDSRSTGTRLRKEVGSWDELMRSALPAADSDGPVRVALLGPGSGLSMLDISLDLGVHGFSDASSITFYDRTAPLRPMFHWWLRSRGVHLVHAAAVGTARGGVLIVGRGGSGKSTTALAAALEGLGYAGDDYSLLRVSPEPEVFSLYCSGKVAATGLHRVPGLAPFVINPDRLETEKAIVWMDEACPGSLLDHFPVRAVIVPRVSHAAHPSLRPASKAEVLAALAPSTMFQLPGGTAETMRAMAGLVSLVPGFVLDLSDDPRPAVELIRELLA